MKTYNSMYLGLCVNNDDPQKRGRVQIFIPHIMPALYESWNKEGKDVEISCVGDNIESALNPEILARLKLILPWAEAASPIIGTSAPGNLSTGGSGGGTYYDTSPVSSPPTSITGNGDLAASANNMIGTSTRGIPDTDGGNLGCAAAVSMIFKNATGHDIIPGKSIVLSTNDLYNHLSTSNNWVRVNIDQIQPGDVLVTARGRKAGHTGVAVGNGRIVSNSSSGFQGSSPGTIQNNYSVDSWKSKIIPRNSQGSGVFRYIGPSTNTGTSNPMPLNTSMSDQTAAAANPHQAPDGSPTITTEGSALYGINTDPKTSQEANIATGQKPTLGNSQVRNFSGNNSEAFVIMRDIAKAAGSPDPDATASIAMLESGWLGSSMSKRANNPFGQTITNRQIGTNGIISGTRGSDGQLHAVYDSLESAVAHHLSKWGSRYVSGNIQSTTNNLVAAGYNTVNAAWSSTVNNIYNKHSQNTSQINTEDLAGNAPTPDSLGINTTLVNNTNPNGPISQVNINNMAKGLFSYPAAGAMLWVFFREGNPLYPVYFAVSYSAVEWSSAYRTASPGIGYNPDPQDGTPQSTGGVLNLNGVGGLHWGNTSDSQDPLANEKNFTLFGEDGSNMSFSSGLTQIYSKFDRRDQVDGDRWTSTSGQKEEWIQGSSNQVCMGDVIIKIGNVSQPAVDAVTRIQQLIKEIQQPLSN